MIFGFNTIDGIDTFITNRIGFVDTAVLEPTAMPAEARLLGELDAVAREHGVAAGPPPASS